MAGSDDEMLIGDGRSGDGRSGEGEGGRGEVCDPGVVSVSDGVRARIGVKGIMGGGKLVHCLLLLRYMYKMMMVMSMNMITPIQPIITVAAIKKKKHNLYDY